MTRRCVADDQYGLLTRRLDEVKRRVDEGTLPFDPVMKALTPIIEGKFNGAGAVPQSPPVTRGILKAHDFAVVGPLKKKFDPKDFFQTGTGLYIWDSFENRVLSAAGVEKPAGKAKLKSFDLTRNAYDREIKAELVAKHEVKLWHIAKLIEAQPSGEDGPLLNNGYANLFYTASTVVSVVWVSDDRYWDVRVWDLDGRQWLGGSRVFFRN